jgi:hypothetical protein
MATRGYQKIIFTAELNGKNNFTFTYSLERESSHATSVALSLPL